LELEYSAASNSVARKGLWDHGPPIAPMVSWSSLPEELIPPSAPDKRRAPRQHRAGPPFWPVGLCSMTPPS